MTHDDFRFHHHNEVPPPSDQVPAWAVYMEKQMALILKELKEMKQSTQDLVTAFNGLSEKINALEDAAAALAAAQTDGSDDAAVQALTKQLLDKTADVVAHTPVVAATIPPTNPPAA